MTKKPSSVAFEDLVLEDLKDPAYAASYLNEVLAHSGPGQQKHIINALRLVTKAHGISKITKLTGRSPKALYASLSAKGNPTLATFLALIAALGIQIQVQAMRGKQSPRGKTSSSRRAA